MSQALLLLLSAVSVLSSSPPRGAPAQGARSLDEAFVAAAKAGDLEGIMKLYAEDAVLYPPGEMPQKGFEAVRFEWKEALEANVFQEVRLEETACRTSGSLSVSWGRFHLTLAPRAAGKRVKTTEGRYTSVAEKRSGKWVYIAVAIGDFREAPLLRPTPTRTPRPR